MAIPPEKLWVLLKSTTPRSMNRPIQVPTKDCKNVDDFIEGIKKKLSPKLDQVAVDDIALHPSKDLPALESDEPIPNQNTKDTALVVVVTAAVPQIAGPRLKAHRHMSFRKLAVAASCRGFLDAVAKELKVWYRFDCMYMYKGATIGDVLRAKRGVEGDDWSIEVAQKDHTKVDSDGFTSHVKKGTPLTSTKLPDAFTDDEWTKLSKFNDMTINLVHAAVLPTLRTGNYYVIVPHANFTDDMIDFLKTVGVKASLFPDKSWLEVKDEETLSEGSSLN